MEAPNSRNAGKSCINKVQILREEESMKRWLGRKSFLAVLVGLLLVLGWADTALAATNDNNVEWFGLFSDQTALYMSPVEPTATQPVTVRVRTFRGDITSANIKYFDQADGRFHWVPMRWVANDVTGVFDFWQGTIPASASRKWYRFQINDGLATAWLNAQGITATEPTRGDFWVVPGFQTPDWVKNGIFYQIFPDRFRDGNPTNNVRDGQWVYEGFPTWARAWNDLPEQPPRGRDFFGGDIIGIRDKLAPYLQQQLGITGIYLTPIFHSPSNHKYDTRNYWLVDPHFGSNADLQNLMANAHSTNNFIGDYRVGVVLDGVFNHSGCWNRWFDKHRLYPTDGAFESRASQWFPYYTFRVWPHDYVAWWGFPTLPKLNYRSSALRDDIYRSASSVAKTWLSSPFFIDGWRLDVANEVGMDGTNTGNHDIWREFRSHVKGVNRNALIVGEYWHVPTSWLGGDQWDSAQNINGFTTPVSRWITGRDLSDRAAAIDTATFDAWIRGTLGDNPWPATAAMWNALSNHDISRFLHRAGGDIGRLRQAAIFQMTFVGAPKIYYGDEIGLTGGPDPDNRRTFNWDSRTWNTEIFNLYRRLISIRRAFPALRTGSFRPLVVDNRGIYAFGRWDATNQIAVALNNTTGALSVSIPVWQMSVPNGAVMVDELSGTSYTVVNGAVTATLGGRNGVILRR
ncbi:alpha-glucosidase [Candidatus Hakubella thermalkaliphila]|uniref:Alpha-glucosidase n=2 Tax=Candidatus Hakubella thermalkaliphila TaxID=2754717 RepID=A0A6V8NN80_9ACTN|nr:alpha-glucosidase [Candidatus Hakubella thermalkaliphila]